MSSLVRSVVTVTTAPAGTGKSYVRAAWFISQEFLPLTNGLHISNFHLHREAVAEEAARVSGKPVNELLERLVVLPQEVLVKWESGDSGPWETFDGWDLSGCHIAIDEIHLYCGAHARRALVDKWMKWLGGIRHAGATVELISQDPAKMAKELDREAAIRLSLVGAELMRIRGLGIAWADVYELRAKLTGKYRAAVWQLEKRKVDGRWTTQDARRFWLEERLFALYDSYNQLAGSSAAGRPEERPWAVMSWPKLLAWFACRNVWGLSKAAAVLLGWLLLFTPVPQKTFGYLMSAVQAAQPMLKTGGESSPTPAVKTGGDADEDLVKQLEGLQAENVQMSREIEDMRNQMALQAADNERVKMEREKLLQERAASSALAAIAPDRIILRGGREFGFGEMISEGEYNGRRVMAIDFGRRLATLDDGTILRLGVGGDGGLLGRVAGATASVSGAVRGVAGAGKSKAGGDGRGTTDNDIGPSATVGGDAAGPGQPTPAKRRR